jgi:transcriptional regulator, AbrB family
MERAKVTRNYQVTIPASIRNRLGIHEGISWNFI